MFRYYYDTQGEIQTKTRFNARAVNLVPVREDLSHIDTEQDIDITNYSVDVATGMIQSKQ